MYGEEEFISTYYFDMENIINASSDLPLQLFDDFLCCV